MKELIEYLKSQRNYTIPYISKYFLTEEINNMLSKYNLDLYELCYRIKKDVQKLKVASKNNLKYLVFWNIQEFNIWYNQI